MTRVKLFLFTVTQLLLLRDSIRRHDLTGLVSALMPTYGSKNQLKCRVVDTGGNTGMQRLKKRNMLGGFSRDPEYLLDLVDELTTDTVNAELLMKMEQVEQALTAFLETAAYDETTGGAAPADNTNNKNAPRPPSIPPPMGAFFSDDDNKPQQDSRRINPDLQRAEIGLQKLRRRLQQEEATLRLAQEALKRSKEEEDILLKAERALQRQKHSSAQNRPWRQLNV
jgi:hypothetical protein